MPTIVIQAYVSNSVDLSLHLRGYIDSLETLLPFTNIVYIMPKTGAIDISGKITRVFSRRSIVHYELYLTSRPTSNNQKTDQTRPTRWWRSPLYLEIGHSPATGR